MSSVSTIIGIGGRNDETSRAVYPERVTTTSARACISQARRTAASAMAREAVCLPRTTGFCPIRQRDFGLRRDALHHPHGLDG